MTQFTSAEVRNIIRKLSEVPPHLRERYIGRHASMADNRDEWRLLEASFYMFFLYIDAKKRCDFLN